MAFSHTKQALMKQFILDRGWIKLFGAVILAGLILVGCGQADREASGGTTTTTVPVTQPDITLPAGTNGARPIASLAGLVRVVDQVGYSSAAVTGADEASSMDSAHRSLVATSGTLHRYAVLLVDVDDEGLDGLATLLDDLVDSVDALTAEVAAGRSDFATAVANLEHRLEAVQRAWAARADEWEAAWERAGREWQAEWDRAAAEWEAEWDRAAAEWEAEWDRAAAEWEAGWAEAAAEWEAGWAEAAEEWERAATEWERAAEDWETAWQDVGTLPDAAPESLPPAEGERSRSADSAGQDR
jgi:hypothetical protein